MSNIAISVENVSKRYLIGHQGDTGDGLRHAIEDAFRNPLRWLARARRARQTKREEFWALNDVTFDVKQGDVIGIIGRNGAGKSTLLKILSRITEPTKGRIVINGRIASLLEVGTGFHQELTGRENIYLNGAILGMHKAEIRRKFDEIVAFSEIDKFLDTPVKRYSSGMYVRLAFAVAAHLEPEILIVDEVLAVGDAQFQQKCLGQMNAVARSGRSVLFVSHNMSAVQALCKRALYLQGGRVAAAGPIDQVVSQYLRATTTDVRFARTVEIGTCLQLIGLQTSPNPIKSGGDLQFSFVLRAKKSTTLTGLCLLIFNFQNHRVAIIDFRPFGLPRTFNTGEVCRFEADICSMPLIEGDYSLGLFVNTPDFIGDLHDLNSFSVRPRAGIRGFAPYPIEYRGHVELEATARILDNIEPSQAELPCRAT